MDKIINTVNVKKEDYGISDKYSVKKIKYKTDLISSDLNNIIDLTNLVFGINYIIINGKSFYPNKDGEVDVGTLSTLSDIQLITNRVEEINSQLLQKISEEKIERIQSDKTINVTKSTVDGYITFTNSDGNSVDIWVGSSGSGGGTDYNNLANIPLINNIKLMGNVNSESLGLVSKIELNSKQDKLESGLNIKTINNQSILGSGNITIKGGGEGGTFNYEELNNKPKINNVELNGDKTSLDLNLQELLKSGTNIKTINGEDILGSGNIDIQSGGVSNYSDLDNKPKINNVELNGNKNGNDLQLANLSDLDDKQDKLESGVTIKTINGNSLLELGNLELQEKLISNTNIKTINNQSILGSGNIDIQSGESDYNKLSNKPKINNIEITGNKNGNDLQLANLSDLDDKQDKLISSTNIKTINGESVLGSGDLKIDIVKDKMIVPVGTILAYPSNVIPFGFLICNGAEYLRTDYPELFTILKDTPYGIGDGSTTFNVPDYRECELVGCGTNGMFDITQHDPVELGEFKDDQTQGHKHTDSGHYHDRYNAYYPLGNPVGPGNFVQYASENTGIGYANLGLPTKYNDEYGEPRNGKTTHGKQVGINYIIKATNINDVLPTDIVVDDRLCTDSNVWTAKKVNDLVSYSTEETIVGIWIDGRPIYRKTFYSETSSFATSTHFITPYINNLIYYSAMYRNDYDPFYPEIHINNRGNENAYINITTTYAEGTYWTIEYIKTTD